jgi:hypothetical protein
MRVCLLFCQVRRMIDTKRCVGIRTDSNQLVSWCLTYEYGAIGMLYTLPVSFSHHNQQVTASKLRLCRIIEGNH